MRCSDPPHFAHTLTELVRPSDEAANKPALHEQDDTACLHNLALLLEAISVFFQVALLILLIEGLSLWPRITCSRLC